MNACQNEDFEDRNPEDHPQDGPPDEEVSLAGLTAAFAEAIGRRAAEDDACVDRAKPEGDVADVLASGVEAPPDELPATCDVRADAEDPCPINPQTILEAMLFVGNLENRPLESRRAAELMRGVQAEEIPVLVDRLNSRYAANGCPYRIFSEGSGYRMHLDESFHALRNKFYGRAREARLSQAAIEVLAIVAYRQPIGGDAVNHLRDKPCGQLLTQLVRRRLLQIERPRDKPNKPLYRTTPRFLELFALKSIDELPRSENADISYDVLF
jgi:segregation and condensation protein B